MKSVGDKKGVDILLAVDMMNHAIRQNMRRAILLTGDADFQPSVESMVQIGMFVEIMGDSKRTARSLVRAADASELLSFDEYFSLAPTVLQNKFPVPEKRITRHQKGNFQGSVLAVGKVGEMEVVVSHSDQYNAYIPIENTNNAHVLRHPDLQRLKLFMAIQFPDVILKS